MTGGLTETPERRTKRGSFILKNPSTCFWHFILYFFSVVFVLFFILFSFHWFSLISSSMDQIEQNIDLQLILIIDRGSVYSSTDRSISR